MPCYVVRGRSADDPKIEGKALCRRSSVVERAAIRGVSVRKQICPSCPFNEQCGSMRQDREIEALGDRALFILARNYLFLPSPAPPADILIADESVVMEAANIVECSPEVLLTADMGAQSFEQTLSRLHNALQQPIPLVALREAGVSIQPANITGTR